MKDCVRNLIEKGKARKRLTEQLQDILTAVAQEIAESVPLGTEVTVDGVTYRTHRYQSNVGSYRTVVVVDRDIYGPAYRAIDDAEPGSTYYLHRDFHTVVAVATRQELLHFANHLPEIIREFEAKEDGVIEQLRSAFEQLQEMAESTTPAE